MATSFPLVFASIWLPVKYRSPIILTNKRVGKGLGGVEIDRDP